MNGSLVSRGRGKAFEREMFLSLQEWFKDEGSYYIERNPDRFSGSGVSAKSPPDLLSITKSHSYLIECKSRSSPSLSFVSLPTHQAEYLDNFEKIKDECQSFIAVNFYSKRKGSRYNIAYMIPYSYWSGYQIKYPRKSISMKHLEIDIPWMKMERANGIWTRPKGII